jgi:hypothetical protein
LTQEVLAFEAEIDLTYVGGIERGKRKSLPSGYGPDCQGAFSAAVQASN